MLEKPHLPLELTGEEVFFLTDAILNKDIVEGLDDKDAYITIGRRALLLLGGAYVELVPEAGGRPYGSVSLQVDEEIVWLLRSKVKNATVASDGKTNLGVPLLRKLYILICRFQAELDGLIVSDVDEPPVTFEQLERLKEFHSAYPSTNPST